MENKNYVITIGREFGSCGMEIGKIVAKKLGIKVYYKELVEMAAERMGMRTAVLMDIDETFANNLQTYITTPKKRTLQDTLFETEAEIIKELAEKESCVIVGHCASYVLREFKNTLNLFVYAPYGVRFNHLLNEYQLTREATENMIESVDKARHAYYKHYTKANRGSRDNRQIMFDSSVLGVEKTAEVVEHIVKLKFDLE